ncbi:Bilirubin oxidase [Paramyrothecium foliicola]|nr:Bilirubin oxidase [Paramyrothecium foliicola]
MFDLSLKSSLFGSIITQSIIMVAHNLGLLALSLGLLEGATALPKQALHKRQAQAQISPEIGIYEEPLPIPPVKEPKHIIENPITGADIRYYEINIEPFTHDVYPDLESTELTGYDGISPGPTIIVPRDTESVVRFVNNAGQENSVHLHGSYSRAPFDGWAEDVTNPGEYKDYYYPNQQSGRLLWYHDHAMHITAQNAYRGQAGAYILTDPAEDALNLPSGYGVHDIPIILSSKQYNENGTLWDFAAATGAWYGDVIHVNGQPWPFFDVEPRKYRFRILNAAVSRSFALYFADSESLDAELPFQVIASDSGLLTGPVETDHLLISMAERYEIVFDFSQYAGQTIDLRNQDAAGGFGTDITFENTDKVMRFNVASELSEPDTSEVPTTLRDVPFPEGDDEAIDHTFEFERFNNQWTINEVTFADVENRILANVPRDTIEIWELTNDSNFWSHPIHVHLVDFRIISRSNGRLEEYESAGLKDVVWLGLGETAVVEAHYAPWPGVYMFHCHNLIHEDDDMMAAFNVTVLPDYGYNETTYLDPMEEEWRAKPFDLTDFTAQSGPFSEDTITERVQFMASFQPYLDDSTVDPNSPEAIAAGRRVKRDGVTIRRKLSV